MKSASTVVAVLCVLLAVAVVSASVLLEEELVMRRRFSDFQHQYKKTYKAEDFQYRFNVFKANVLRYEEANRKSGRNTWGVTQFSDLTPAEFSQYYLMPKSVHENFQIPANKVAPPSPAVNVPSSFDWNSKGVVTPVYNQGQCGSCWAFSATETIESYCAIAGKGLQSLSMQQIVDCDSTAYGCNGGWTYAAYQYVQQAGGIEYFQDYPYTAQDESCAFNSADIFSDISGWGYVTQNEDEGKMASFLYTTGPLSVCVDASNWSGYQPGTVVTASDCGRSVDHCVQATGFDVKDGTPIWNVRNSWGTQWGNQGYIWVERGTNACDIASTVTYVSC